MTGAAGPPLLTRPFLLACASHFLHGLSLHLYLHLPGFLRGVGASEIEIGFIYGAMAATAILARPLIGRVMDRRGRLPIVLAGGALATISCALYLTVSGLGPWVVTVRAGHGVAEAMLFASLFAYAADMVPAARRIEGIALFGVSGMLPMALGGLLGDVILARGGYRDLFIASALCSASGLALSVPLREAAAPAGLTPPRGVAAAFAQRDLLPLWLVGLAFATALAAPFTFLKTFVLSSGVGSVGGFFTAYAGSAIALRVGLGSLPERLGPKRVLFPALGSLSLGLGALAAGGAAWVVIAAGVLCGVGHGYTFPILVGLVVTRARASERGAALSIFTALFDGGMLLGGPALGAIVGAAGYPAMFCAAAAVVVAGAAAFAAWDGEATK